MDAEPTSAAKTAALWALRMMALVLGAGVLLSSADFNEWWIRMWDFPRVQLAVAMALLGTALLVFDPRSRPWLPLAMAALVAWQLYRIHPYTPVAPSTVAQFDADTESGGACFSTFMLNVLQDNRDFARTLDAIERVDPDLVLLMETDAAWTAAIAPLRARYTVALERPLDNRYGIALYTRLATRDATIRDLTQKDTPSIFATVTAGARDFRLIALHPRPPQPGQDTEERDAELVVAARHAREQSLPVLALGDFNDVAWSDTTTLFMETGKFLDPRMGRGTYATFPADMVWLGWPLDHLFVTEEFLLREMRVLGPVGSDHRPIFARVCLDPAMAQANNAEAEGADGDTRDDAQEVMEEYRADTAEDRRELEP